MEESEKEKEREDRLKKATNRKRKELTNRYKAIFYGFFSASYDNQYIFKSKRLRFQSIIDNHGILQLYLEGGYIEFRDAVRMTGISSLDALCHDYKLPPEFSKTRFPHPFASSENLNYIGIVPEAKYWGDTTEEQKIPEEHIGKIFNFKEISNHYQKLDCVSECIILHRERTTFLQKWGLDIFDFLTAPSLAQHYTMLQAPPRNSNSMF